VRRRPAGADKCAGAPSDAPAEDGWVVGYIEEVRDAYAFGRTIDEAREQLVIALRLALRVARLQSGTIAAGLPVILREPIGE